MRIEPWVALAQRGAKQASVAAHTVHADPVAAGTRTAAAARTLADAAAAYPIVFPGTESGRAVIGGAATNAAEAAGLIRSGNHDGALVKLRAAVFAVDILAP